MKNERFYDFLCLKNTALRLKLRKVVVRLDVKFIIPSYKVNLRFSTVVFKEKN